MSAEDESMLLQSARTFVQYLSTELKRYAYSPAPPQEDLSEYMTVLNACQEEYAAYRRRTHKRTSTRNQQLLIDTKLSLIPPLYFAQDYKLELVRRSEAHHKQEELAEILDEIEIILFAKVAKYPQSSTVILDNLAETDSILHLALNKVKTVRTLLAQRVKTVVRKQQRINQLNAKIARLHSLVSLIQICKRVRNLKVAAASESDSVKSEQLLTIKKKELQRSQKIVSLRRIVLNIQSYRSSIKEGVYSDFQRELQQFLKKQLEYSRQEMREKEEKEGQVSMNITVLDQSDFVFDTQQSSMASGVECEVGQLGELWGVMSRFDIYEEEEVNEFVGRILLRHAFAFTQDMHAYFAEACKAKNVSYAAIKKTHLQDRLTLVPMRVFVRVVRFYFDILKRLLSAINALKPLTFLTKFKPNLYAFIGERLRTFLNMKKITEDSQVEDFVLYVNLIQYWLMEEEYALHPPLQSLFEETVNEYLTVLQTHQITKELKEGLEASTFLPVALPSSHYPTFYAVVHRPSSEPSFLRFLDTRLVLDDREYRACEAFLLLMPSLQRYLRLRDLLSEFLHNINEKICEVVGFYAWYGHKVITNPKGPQRTLLNLCTFFSNLQLLETIFCLLEISGKKSSSTQQQIHDCKEQIKKHINMTPYMMIEEQISLVYDYKALPKNAPLAQSMQIVGIIRQTIASLREIFPPRGSVRESTLASLLQPCLKLITKNYFGYLITLDKRGSLQLKWFLPKIREALEITVFKTEKQSKNQSLIHCLYQGQIQDMERILFNRGK